MNNNQIEEYNKAIIKGDTDAANKLRAKAMKKWLIEDVNGSSRFQRIMNAEYGNDGVIQLNELLASRAVNGNIGLDASQILKMAGFKESSDGWYELTKGSTKVMSPHKIMQNILKYESGNGFTITDVKGGKTTREDIIKQLSDIEAEDYLWTNASTKTRASRTKAVTPQTVSDTGGYILAPNDKGVPTLYMKVAIKQGAKGWDIGSWFPQG
jgi:lysozyme family protein